MKVEMSKAKDVRNTPSAIMVNYVCEHVTALMILGGIQSIVTQKFESGFGSRLHVRISQFKEAPSEVHSAGIIIKDALAQILSVANITRLALKPTDKEMANIKSNWEKSVEQSKVVKEVVEVEKAKETDNPNDDGEIPIKMEGGGK